jgi:hypothetical protein
LERRFVTAASLAVALTSLGVLVVAGVIDHVDAERDQLRAQHQRAGTASLVRARDDLWRDTRAGAVFTLARSLDARPVNSPIAPALLDALALLPPHLRPRVTEVLDARGTVLATSSRPSPIGHCGAFVHPEPLRVGSARVVATFDLPCAPVSSEVIPPPARRGPSLPLALLGADRQMEGGCGPIAETDEVFVQQLKLTTQLRVQAARYSGDMRQLHRISHEHRPAAAKQQWDDRSDVALACFVENHNIENPRLERNPSTC